MHSLSKRSNLAGYRCAFVAGDPPVVAELLAVRRNLGLMMPGPQQRAMIAALDDDEHVAEQHARYAARRTTLRAALESAGFRIDHSEAALYLWATRDEPCWDTVDWLADRGILVAPGAFYGRAGERHVRVAFTATDERVAAAAARLIGLGLSPAGLDVRFETAGSLLDEQLPSRRATATQVARLSPSRCARWPRRPCRRGPSPSRSRARSATACRRTRPPRGAA